jgi:cytochrome P450
MLDQLPQSTLPGSDELTVDEFFNPLSAEVIRDPYPTYHRLRAHDPVYWHRQLQAWVLTRHAECQSVLRDSERFAADFRRVGIPTPPTLLSLQTLDPPDQTPLRHLGLATLRAQDLTALAETLTERASGLLRELAGQGHFDFVRNFSDRFTMDAITTLLGVTGPAEDATFHKLNASLDHSMDAGFAPDAEAAGIRARARFNELVESWLDDPPATGALAYLAAHQMEGQVSREVLVNSIRGFFHAGFEVPNRFLGNAMLVLLRQPAAYHARRAGAALESAVEELVRHSGPGHALSRACTEDLVIGDKKVKRGQRGGGAHQGRRPRPGPVRGPRHAATGPSAQSTPWVWLRLPFLPGRNGWPGRGKSDAVRARGRPADADPRRRSTAPPERDTARAVPASVVAVG